MIYEEAEARIHALTRFGSQKGLERMGRLMALLGNPQEQLPFVHVAGTNGKGTTSRLIASVLERAGFRTGLFISPFVVEFRERYQINGSMIPKEDFAALMEELLPRLRQLSEAGDEVTEFEAVTALGFLWFARQKCDIVVLEVGLGGRFDATNIIPPPLCGVIASISMDHTAILGDTLEQIAFEKAGIIKQDMDVVTYPFQAPEVLGVFYERCARTGSRLIQPSPGAMEILEETAFGSEFVYGGERCRLPFPGRHQIGNALDAIEALQVLRRKGFAISREQLREGLETARLPARFEVLSRSPLVILDGAHNLQAAQGLADTLALVKERPRIAVMGMMRDKDCRSVLEIIGGQCDQLIAVPVLGMPRALPPEEFAALAAPCFSHTEAWTEHLPALRRAAELAGPSGAVVLCGSFYLASQLRPLVPRMCARRG